MARAKLYETLIDAEGDIIVGATVTVRQPGTGTAITETMYAANSGGTTLTNPLTSTSDGSVTFYLDAGRRVDLFVEATGYADKTLSYVPVLHDPADIVLTSAIASVSSASSINLGTSGNVFQITGTTTITTITARSAGSIVWLYFASTANLAPGGNIQGLPGRFIPIANDSCQLMCDGTNWHFVGPRPGLVPIAKVELGATGDIDFQSIPGEFVGLRVTGRLRGSNASTNVEARVRLNNDSGANYNYLNAFEWNGYFPIKGNGATFGQLCNTPAASTTADRAAAFVLDLPSYASTTWHKTLTCEAGASFGNTDPDQLRANSTTTWRSTAAVTRLAILASAGQWASGSHAYLYGVVGP